LSEPGPQENPLIPNKKLRQMFVVMTEMRVLDEYIAEHIAGLQRGRKARRRLDSTAGQEACRVSTAIDLETGDLVSDAFAGVAMELVAGAPVDSLLRHAAELASETKKRGASFGGDGVARQLPWIEDVGDRLRMAMGAALAFKTMKQTNIVVAYVRHGEVSNGLWRQILSLASTFELPVIFVVLPEGPGKKKKRDGAEALTARARSWGVPGIPVDAGDAVALYRVAQESIGRTRSNGGPVLVECVTYQLKNERKASVVDPIAQMKSFLMGRKVCTEAWLDRAGDRLRKRIQQDRDVAKAARKRR
jgi:acetoin:2,6-dichlorophenolindophenol oxidoreductase subunit alpha